MRSGHSAAFAQLARRSFVRERGLTSLKGRRCSSDPSQECHRLTAAAAGGVHGARRRTAIGGRLGSGRARNGRNGGAPGGSGNGACGGGCKARARPAQLEPRSVADTVPGAGAGAGGGAGLGLGLERRRAAPAQCVALALAQTPAPAPTPHQCSGLPASRTPPSRVTSRAAAALAPTSAGGVAFT